MIKLQDINFGYRQNKLLFDKLSFEATPGAIYGLLGKNGAGKTTLLKIIGGLRNPEKGLLDVFGFVPFHRKWEYLEQVCMVPEDLDLPSFSIKQYLNLYSSFYPLFDTLAFRQNMDSFDMDINMHLGQLSFGQKKKFILSFAMATGAKLVMFDEPTNGLDIPSKSVFRKLAASSINEERTFIISTHQVRDLNTLIDSLILIEKGSIVLNSSIAGVAEKYRFAILPRNHGRNDLIYSEEHIEGIKAILPNENGDETFVDLELLFNAIMFKKIN